MQQVKLTLPMIPDMELTASKTACALGEQIGLSPDKIDEVQMAVVEACINAFEHSGAASREVQVLLQILGPEGRPEGLQIVIRDSGVGFAPDRIAKSRAEEILKSPRKRGHGLKIIKGLMDEVDIQSGADGTIVIMRKMR